MVRSYPLIRRSSLTMRALATMLLLGGLILLALVLAHYTTEHLPFQNNGLILKARVLENHPLPPDQRQHRVTIWTMHEGAVLQVDATVPAEYSAAHPRGATIAVFVDLNDPSRSRAGPLVDRLAEGSIDAAELLAADRRTLIMLGVVALLLSLVGGMLWWRSRKRRS